MNPDLRKYSTSELLDEIQKRKNNDWYFIVKNNVDLEEEPDFLIVHKRTWHQNHDNESLDISNLIDLPEGFKSSGRHIYQYKGSFRYGVTLLKRQGFTKLDNPFWDCKVSYYPDGKIDSQYKIDFICDTKKIKNLTNKFIEKLPVDQNIEYPYYLDHIYESNIKNFIQENKLIENLLEDYDYHRDEDW